MLSSSQYVTFFVQGHSAWGQFELIGRVRPGDGFITLSKEYVSSPSFLMLLTTPPLLIAELKSATDFYPG
jgi:hypothetical protein